MKAALFIEHFKRLEDVNNTANPSGSVALYRNLFQLFDIFQSHKNKQVLKVLEQFSDLKIVENQDAPKIETLVSFMNSVARLFEGCATKALNNDLQAFLQFLESYKSYSIDDVVNAAKKQSAKPKKQKKKVDQNKINEVIENLKKVIGQADSFAKAYDASNLDDLTVDEVRAIAKGFNSKTPANASKKKALSIINERHEELVKYNQKSKSMSGRSAA